MGFVYLVITVLGFIYLQNRLGKIEDRLNALGRNLVTSGTDRKPSATDEAVRSSASAPFPAPNVSSVFTPGDVVDFQKEGVHAGEIFRVATVARPAPMPPRNHDVVAGSSTSASHEEQTARWLGRIGAVALIAGIAFFLKYAFDNRWIDEIGRVAIAH